MVLLIAVCYGCTKTVSFPTEYNPVQLMIYIELTNINATNNISTFFIFYFISIKSFCLLKGFDFIKNIKITLFKYT